MQRRNLGSTGISVSSYALGTMMLGAWGNRDHDACVRIVQDALAAGINLVDTADMYSDGETEEVLGRALKGRRDDVVVATKFRHPMGEDPNHSGASRRWIVQAVEGSLRRLGTDWIDLYQVHRPDPATDIDETLSALSDLVRSGKVRAIGTSTFPPDRMVEARWVSERRGHVYFHTEQPQYSMLSRGVEADVLPVARRYGMGVLTWGPLGAGWLSDRDVTRGAVRAGLEPQKFDMSVPDNICKAETVGRLRKVAAEAGLPLAHMAVAFARAHPAVTSVIIGPRTPEQLADLLAGADVQLDEAVLDRIDEIVPPGIDVNRAGSYYVRSAVSDPSSRRRSS
ncbi:aldo/keto reductase [Streptomyces sp. NPDC060006]|uniref:aldo/keto reductase n=1 Tax=unclassified Streptomyces TaxID=2593676 RepID=UPI00362D0C86